MKHTIILEGHVNIHEGNVNNIIKKYYPECIGWAYSVKYFKNTTHLIIVG